MGDDGISRWNMNELEGVEYIPPLPGVYIFYNQKGDTLYIGKAADLSKRLRYYLGKSLDSPRLRSLQRKIKSVELLVTKTEFDALELEAELVYRLKPKYNVELKDDKRYPYIKITDEPFPRITVVRRKKRDNAYYFGPYTKVGSMRRSLKILQDIFKVRGCKYKLPKKGLKPCLDYHIDKCSAPCAGHISQEDYFHSVQELVAFLSGRRRELIAKLKAEMMNMAAREEFEKAALFRDRIQALEQFLSQSPIDFPEINDADFIQLKVVNSEGYALTFVIREGAVIERRFQKFYPGLRERENEKCEGYIQEQLSENQPSLWKDIRGSSDSHASSIVRGNSACD